VGYDAIFNGSTADGYATTAIPNANTDGPKET
jgi:hypothetical protein